MKQIKEPQVFLIGETQTLEDGKEMYLNWLGCPEWESTTEVGIQELIEMYGRVCYKSFAVDPNLNPNVLKIRESNDAYLKNIIEVKHGAVLEHSMVNFIFADVSRVLTHELVRHRIGLAISQESLRFVRLNNLRVWIPTVFQENAKALEIFIEWIESSENYYERLEQCFDWEALKNDMAKKKEITSGLRRGAPIGLGTSIGWSCNIRTLRWVIEQRTSEHAEQEIRIVFGRVFELSQKRYPNLFFDFKRNELKDGTFKYTPENSKV